MNKTERDILLLQKSEVPIPEGLHAGLVTLSPGGCSGLLEGQAETMKGMELLLYKHILKKLGHFSLERERLRGDKMET